MPKSKMKASKTADLTGSKQARVIKLLQVGANIDTLVKATGWQPHSVRAVISGLRKAGYRIDLERTHGKKSVYRIVAIPKGLGKARS